MDWRHLLIAGCVVTACSSQPAQKTLTMSAAQSDHLATNLPSWSTCSDPGVLEPWTGFWADPTGRISIAFVCRKQPGAGLVLFGAIPTGRYEGTLILDRNDPYGGLSGSHLRADRDFAVSTAVLTRSTLGGVRVRIGDGQEIPLHRDGDIDVEQLKNTVIVGHRGASLGEPALMNSLTAILHARSLGADGIEIDITVPYRKGKSGKEPVFDDLVVHHPPEVRSELTGFDSAPIEELASKPRLDAALRAARDHGIAMVYLDPKVRWLLDFDRSALQRALRKIVTTALADASQDHKRWLVIGAEAVGQGEQGDVLETVLSAEHAVPENLTWAPEVTRGTDEHRFVNVAGRSSRTRPQLLSFNLLRLKGGGGGLLSLLLRDLSPDGERAMHVLPQVRAFWTVHTQRQLQGVLQASMRLEADRKSRVALIITPFPHRAVYWLGSTSLRR